MKYFISLLVLWSSCKLVGQNNKTLLAIFPHPDDEMAVAEVLIKYAKQGYKVQFIIAPDGKYGTRGTKISEGDSLGNLKL